MEKLILKEAERIMSEINTDEALRLIESEDVSVIDVREAVEFEAGTIPGAVLIPLGELEARVSELDKNKKHIMICRSGARSGTATEYLISLGYNATNMAGGIIDWKGEVIS